MMFFLGPMPPRALLMICAFPRFLCTTSKSRCWRGCCTPSQNERMRSSPVSRGETPSAVGKRCTRTAATSDVRMASAHRRYGAVPASRPAVEDRLHFRRVPRHDYVGEQVQRVGDGLHFVLALGLIIGDAAGVDQALQGVGGFAAIEHAQ